MRTDNRGSFLFFSLFIVSLLSTLMAVGLTRAMTELLSANRFAILQRAFYLAEAGIDAKLVEFQDGVSGNDEQPIPAQSVPGGTYGVVVGRLAGNLFEMNATGTAGSISQRVRAVVERQQKLQTPGAVTVVGAGDTELLTNLFQGGLPGTEAFKGCDITTGTCLPAITVTADRDYAALVGYINTTDLAKGYFGGRLPGAQSDLGDHLPNGRYIIAGDYSIHKASPGEQGNLGYDALNDLAAWAKAQAQQPQNNCYFNRNNDDQADPAIKQLTLQDRTLGTVSQPKVCYAEYDFRTNADGTYAPPSQTDPSWDVSFTGLNNTGAGVLVIKGELQILELSRLTYKGIIVIVGPSAEFETHGDLRSQEPCSWERPRRTMPPAVRCRAIRIGRAAG